ncbi:MAG TPA: hypothetical protein PKD90_10110 [Phnomibacter sp.]|nr:hypothetical protein [Phnomibacter sp.]
MPPLKILRVFALLFSLSLIVQACGSAKRGCKSTSSSMGAERVLAGEKPEKKQKFKIKGMN